MKKIITILAILMVIVGSVFAATGDKLFITAEVTAVKPEFSMFGALDSADLDDITYETDGSGNAKVGSASKATTNTLAGGNIATEAINVYVKVLQNNKSYYLNSTGFDLTVTASALTGSNGGSVSPSITASANGGSTTDFKSAKTSATNSIVTWKVQYLTGSAVAAGALVGTCAFQYPATPTAPVGTYSATITLAYTAN